MTNSMLIFVFLVCCLVSLVRNRRRGKMLRGFTLMAVGCSIMLMPVIDTIPGWAGLASTVIFISLSFAAARALKRHEQSVRC